MNLWISLVWTLLKTWKYTTKQNIWKKDGSFKTFNAEFNKQVAERAGSDRLQCFRPFLTLCFVYPIHPLCFSLCLSCPAPPLLCFAALKVSLRPSLMLMLSFIKPHQPPQHPAAGSDFSPGRTAIITPQSFSPCTNEHCREWWGGEPRGPTCSNCATAL